MLFNNIYKNRAVFVTGHTGFKGAWLAAWLDKLGSRICGYALDVPSEPNLFSLLNLPIQDVRGDVLDVAALTTSVQQFEPEIVFHLAAQSLVPLSFQQPLETFATNILGTAHLLEVCRQTPSVRAVVIITSDKCYSAGTPASGGHRETDPLGGDDPYSASKACAEIVAASYRQSFLDGRLLVATCRSGNAIGGGDWVVDRLMPDLIRSAVGGKNAVLRMPQAVRPWQHVLNPLFGYLLLGQRLLEGRAEFAEAWNFGPSLKDHWTVEEIAQNALEKWDNIRYKTVSDEYSREVSLLMLDSQKAHKNLGWSSPWDLTAGIEKTLSWYRHFYKSGELQTFDQIAEFERGLE